MYLSPQLYTSGGEGVPQLEPLQGELGDIEWDLYKGMKAKFVPSIVGKGQVKAVKDFFEPLGIKVDGYVTWGQEHVADDAPTTASCFNYSAEFASPRTPSSLASV